MRNTVGLLPLLLLCSGLATPVWAETPSRWFREDPVRCSERVLTALRATSDSKEVLLQKFLQGDTAVQVTETEIRLLTVAESGPSLAWSQPAPADLVNVLKRGKLVVPIPGASRDAQLDFSLWEFTAELVWAGEGKLHFIFETSARDLRHQVLSLENGQTVQDQVLETGDRPTVVRPTADHKLVANATASGHVEIWDLTSGALRQRYSIDERRGAPIELRFAEGRKKLLVATSPYYHLTEEQHGGYFVVADIENSSSGLRYYAHPEMSLVASTHVVARVSPTEPTERKTTVEYKLPWLKYVEVFESGGQWFAGFSYFEDGGGRFPPQFRKHWILDLQSPADAPRWHARHYQFLRLSSQDNSKWLGDAMGAADQKFGESDYQLKVLDPVSLEVLGVLPPLPEFLNYSPGAVSNDGRFVVIRIGDDFDGLGQFWLFELGPNAQYVWKGAIDRRYDWPEQADYSSKYRGDWSGATLSYARFSDDGQRLLVAARGENRVERSLSIESIVRRGTEWTLPEADFRIVLARDTPHLKAKRELLNVIKGTGFAVSLSSENREEAFLYATEGWEHSPAELDGQSESEFVSGPDDMLLVRVREIPLDQLLALMTRIRAIDGVGWFR